MDLPAQSEPRPAEALMPLVYEELRGLARAYFRKQPPSFTLRPTDVVHEACLHLLRHGRQEWDSPEQFRAIATRKIWQVIIDHLKRRHARKRGGPARPPSPVRARAGEAREGAAPAEPRPSLADAGQRPVPQTRRHRVPLDGVAIEWCDRTVDLLDLADALDALEAESRRLRDVVMLHWFGGLKHAEVGQVLGLSAATVEKDFRYALAWLNRRLTGGAADGD